VTHHFTVDVEEHFQVSALAPYVPRSHWESMESRVVANTTLLLRLLEEADQKATFFTLGWVAERAPELVRRLAAGGHEIASHGWDHRKVTDETPAQFRESVRRSKELLEQITGVPVLGYRAPSFSIVEGREWALDILLEEGYVYDSSLFPIHRPGYGYAAAKREPHWLDRAAGRLAEMPPATIRRFGVNIPAAGGAYLRLLPAALIRAAVRDAEARGVPATLYIHPWELDPDQPRIAASLATRIRHYGGLTRTVPRLRRLFQEFRFRPIAESLPALHAL
jgi:polysaccharide deacetylase family protein (PEP-CTERM system associated)